MSILEFLFGDDGDSLLPWKGNASGVHDRNTPDHYTEYEDGYTGIKFDPYYFIDDFSKEDSTDKELGEYRLIIGPHPERDAFGIHRCNEVTYIPEGSCLYIANRGDLIDTGGKPFMTVIAELVHPDNINSPENVSDQLLPAEGEMVEAPEEIVGWDIPERNELSEEYLQTLALSFATN